jgi:hypothetical protein
MRADVPRRLPAAARASRWHRSTWGCSWYNRPTASTPQAIATAVCLPADRETTRHVQHGCMKAPFLVGLAPVMGGSGTKPASRPWIRRLASGLVDVAARTRASLHLCWPGRAGFFRPRPSSASRLGRALRIATSRAGYDADRRSIIQPAPQALRVAKWCTLRPKAKRPAALGAPTGRDN